MIGKCILVIAVLCAFADYGIEGKRLILRPISAAKVRQILQAAGREDVIPEGRVFPHGFATLNGFVLGLKKGIIGAAVVESLLSTTTTTTTTTTVKPRSNADELCFNSRSASSGNAKVAESDEDDDSAEKRSPTMTGYATSTGMSSDITSPSASNDATNIGSGLLSASSTTTQTTGGAVNCLLLNRG